MAINSEGPVLASGETSVVTPGTAIALHTASQRIKSVVIIAKSGNAGQLYIGGSDVDDTTNDGLDAGESITLQANGWMDLADLYIDCDSGNTDGVDFYAVKA